MIERAIGLLMGRDGVDGADGLQRVAPGGAQLAPARERRRRGGARGARAGSRPTEPRRAEPARRPARTRGSSRRLDVLCRGDLGLDHGRSPTRGSTSANASSRPLVNARIGNDSDQRRERAVGQDVAHEVGQRRPACPRAARRSRGRAASTAGTADEQQGQVERDARPADAAELVEEAPATKPAAASSAARFQRPPPSADPTSGTSNSSAAAHASPTRVVRAATIIARACPSRRGRKPRASVRRRGGASGLLGDASPRRPSSGTGSRRGQPTSGLVVDRQRRRRLEPARTQPVHGPAGPASCAPRPPWVVLRPG